jgi:hypothetical protein
MMEDQHSKHTEVSSISTIVSNMPQITPFVAPEGYFHTFSDRILSQINGQNIEKEEISPFLQSLRKENPFTIPPAYLEQFQVEVPHIDTKIVRLFNIKTVLKYAAAAAVIGIIATFVTLFSNIESINTIAKSTDDTKISSDAFALYLNETEELNDSEIDTSIDDTQSLLVQMDAGLVSEMLKEIPENEISTYIDLMKSEGLNMMN